MTIFSHSGDIGDIIYSLPTIRALGGGSLILFHSPGKTSHGMDEAKVNRIRPLLELQEYIHEVQWSPTPHETNLNGFRDHYGHGSLTDMHLATYGLSWVERTKAWINNIDPVFKFEVIVARSPRYQNGNFPWTRIVETYNGKIGFIGLRHEYSQFCNRFGKIPFVKADDLLSVAQIIKGSKLYIGNSSCPLAIAEGMKHQLIQEVCPGPAHHLSEVERFGHIMGWSHKLELPEL